MKTHLSQQKYYICDTDWTIGEIESSEGYLVNDEVYKVGADPALYKVEYNTTANNVVEMPIKGKIAIIKHSIMAKHRLKRLNPVQNFRCI